MKMSNETKNIFPAVIKAYGKIQNLYPSQKGYGYDYIPLNKVLDEVKPSLTENGLALIQFPISENDKIGITNLVIHTSGEWIEQEVYSEKIQMKSANQIQANGAVITYLRRYSLISFAGIAGDADTDCHGEEEKNKTVVEDNTLMNKEKIVQEIQSISKHFTDDERKHFISIYKAKSLSDNELRVELKKIYDLKKKYLKPEIDTATDPEFTINDPIYNSEPKGVM